MLLVDARKLLTWIRRFNRALEWRKGTGIQIKMIPCSTLCVYLILEDEKQINWQTQAPSWVMMKLLFSTQPQTWAKVLQPTHAFSWALATAGVAPLLNSRTAVGWFLHTIPYLLFLAGGPLKSRSLMKDSYTPDIAQKSVIDPRHWHGRTINELGMTFARKSTLLNSWDECCFCQGKRMDLGRGTRGLETGILTREKLYS